MHFLSVFFLSLHDCLFFMLARPAGCACSRGGQHTPAHEHKARAPQEGAHTAGRGKGDGTVYAAEVLKSGLISSCLDLVRSQQELGARHAILRARVPQGAVPPTAGRGKVAWFNLLLP